MVGRGCFILASLSRHASGVLAGPPASRGINHIGPTVWYNAGSLRTRTSCWLVSSARRTRLATAGCTSMAVPIANTRFASV